MSCRPRPAPFVAVLVAAVMLLGACAGSSSSSSSSSSSDGDGSVAAVDVARTEADPGQAAAVVGPVSDFGWDAYQQLATDERNLVFSPHSIALALAMTRAGAVGDTASEMDAVLHMGSIGDPHPAINALDLAIESASGPVQRPDETTDEVVVQVSNALWAQDGFRFEQPFLSTLARNYGAGVRQVDYRNDHEAARQDINAWVGKETNDRIEELLAPGVITALTRLVLTNTVYLEAPWDHPFDDQPFDDQDSTTTAPFSRLDGSTAAVELMSVSDSFRYGAFDDLQAIELPYLGRQLSMLVIVPDVGRFSTASARLDTETIDAVVREMQDSEVQLRFPKFEFTTDVGLVDLLRSLGMTVAFDPDRADFSAMTTEAPLFVSDVVHQAFISVDEAGTEAAAATAVVMDLTGAPLEPVQLTVDRPFVLMIRHVETGAPLFIGHVIDPAARP